MTDQMRAVEVPAAGEPFEHVERPVPDPDKEELALEPGADHFVDTSETDAAEALQSMGGARVVLGTAPAADAISNVVGGLGRDGEVVAVGVPGEEVPVDIGHLVGTRGAVKGVSLRAREGLGGHAGVQCTPGRDPRDRDLPARRGGCGVRTNDRERGSVPGRAGAVTGPHRFSAVSSPYGAVLRRVCKPYAAIANRG